MAFPGFGTFGVMMDDQAPAAQWPPQIGPAQAPPAGWKGVPYKLPETGGNLGGALGALKGLMQPGAPKQEEPMLPVQPMQMPRHRPIPLNPVLLGLLGAMQNGMR